MTNASNEATASAAVVGVGSWYLGTMNVSSVISTISGILGIIAFTLAIYDRLKGENASPQIAAAMRRCLLIALPWIKGLAAAFIGGAIVTIYNTISDPATYNWDAGLPKLWHSAWTSGLLASFFYFMRSPFVRQFLPAAPADGPIGASPAVPVPEVAAPVDSPGNPS